MVKNQHFCQKKVSEKFWTSVGKGWGRAIENFDFSIPFSYTVLDKSAISVKDPNFCQLFELIFLKEKFFNKIHLRHFEFLP